MKLISVLAFLGTLGVGLVGAHLALDEGFRRIRQGRYADFNRVARGEVNAELLISGSSRAMLHFDPRVLRQATGLTVFNIGRIGAPTVISTGILRHYLRHNRPPRVLILSIDLHSTDTPNDLYQPVQYAPIIRDSAFYDVAGPRFEQLLLSRYLPLYGYVVNDVEFEHYEGLFALFGIQPRDRTADGYLIRHARWNEESFQRLIRGRKHFYHTPTAIGIADLTQLISEARSRRIPTILVLSPVYRRRMQMTLDREKLLATMGELAERQGAEFWDYSDIDSLSGNTQYFADATHLNAEGAEWFSRLLGQRIAAWLLDHQGASAAENAARQGQPPLR